MSTHPFWKLQATGNDFVLLDWRAGRPATASLASLSRQAQAFCDRHRGIGADGILVVGPASEGAIARMDVVNADGSLPEMCGNGLRAVAAWLAGPGGHSGEETLHIATPSGIKAAHCIHEGPFDGFWEVNLGKPELRRALVPFDLGDPNAPALDEALGFGSETVLISAISMGNPHAVIVVPSLDEVPLADWGPRLEKHPAFPRGANVGFLEVHGRRSGSLRVWERGAGATQACGTGAAAALVAAHLTDRMEEDAILQLPGGPLRVRWPQQEGGVRLAGEASVVFQGEWPLSWLTAKEQ